MVFAGGSQFLAVATIASGGTPLAAVLGGIVLNARHLPYGLAVAPLLRGPLWKRALSSQIVLDESTALALAQPTPELGRLAFYACGCALFVTWNVGTLVGALAGGAIADPSELGLDAAFPASMVALLAPLLRRRDMRAAALAGGAHGARWRRPSRRPACRSCSQPPARWPRASCGEDTHDLVGHSHVGGRHLRAQGGRVPSPSGPARCRRLCSARSTSSR